MRCCDSIRPALLIFLALFAGSPAAWAAVDVRLGRDVVPTFEAVRLRLDADRPGYSGSVHMTLAVKKPTETFRFHAEGQTLERVALLRVGTEVPIRFERGERGVVTVTAGALLSQGEYRLEVGFSHVFNTRSVSLYRAKRGEQGFLYTQFQPDEAREAFPCWDEPSFKIPYQLTLEVPEKHEAVSNTPVESQEVRDGWKTVVFRKTPPMPSYLVALATGPLEFTPIPGLKVPARVVTGPGQARLAALAVEMTPRLLAAVESYFGTPYPYEKLDLIAGPEFWPGAMENPGAVTFMESILLLDPERATRLQKSTLARIVTHELAHMWFGNLVTMEWWDDLWLNESFAEWLSEKIADQVYTELRVSFSRIDLVQEMMDRDARPSAQAIRQPILTAENVMRTTEVAYNKGKPILGMFEAYLGEETFRKGLREFLREHAWGNATAGDLWRALSRAAGQDVAALMGGFIDQPGFPLVRVEPLPGGKVRLSQQRFLNDGVQGAPLQWKVPIRLKYSDGKTVRTTRVLLSEPSRTLQLEGVRSVEWVMPNQGGYGYYRWTAPPEMLLVLANRAGTTMEARERMSFLGNLESLLYAKAVRGDTYFQVLAELASDPEPLVLSSLLTALEAAKLPLAPEELEDEFAVYLRRTLRPALDRIGLEKRAGEDGSLSGLRAGLLRWLGRFGRDPEILEYARTAMRRYLADSNSVDPSVAGVVLQLAAMDGDPQLFDEYRKRFEAATVPSERGRFLNALGSFRNPELQQKALRYTLEGPIRPNEFFRIPAGVGDTDHGSDIVFAWERENFARVVEKIPPTVVAYLPHVAEGCSAARLQLARDFFSQPAHSVPGTAESLAQAADQVSDCVRLREREGARVESYLASLAVSTAGTQSMSQGGAFRLRTPPLRSRQGSD
ncbi:MAG TPA: M1 family aminopeptidase [Thermoanaerobaculia bacterium]|nr:M1 family aminopeptidase [Thermoanaerobaculia bacterium]